MRRVFLAAVAAGLVMGGAAGPALAATHNHSRFSDAYAFAFWHKKVRLAPGKTEVTTWFVQVYQYAGHTNGQVGEQVVKCKRVNGHPRCRLVSFSFGYRRLTASQATLDRKKLESAHLDAAFKLRTFVRGKPRTTSTVTVVADWTGTGKIIRSGSINNYRSGCMHFHDVSHGKSRKATATGTFNKIALGSARDSYLATNTDSYSQHRC